MSRQRVDGLDVVWCDGCEVTFAEPIAGEPKAVPMGTRGDGHVCWWCDPDWVDFCWARTDELGFAGMWR